MSETSPSAEAGPPAVVDVQDPLPESNWFWRRVVSIGVLIVNALVDVGAGAAFIWFERWDELLSLVHWNLIGGALTLLLYMGGANMAEITRLVQSSKLFQSGKLSFRSTSTASSPEGGRAAAETVIAPVDPAAAPPPPAAPARADTVTFPWEQNQ